MMREDLEDRRAERKQQKMMTQIMTMIMMKMMGERRGAEGALGAFGSSPMNAFMFPEIEYVVQDGKILTDDYGNPVPSRMRYFPMTAYMMASNQQMKDK